ncbi:INSIG domain [Cordyceps militaris]|uniref:INSIG domain n=1 Tax=Cordyceps militaris TaxID=73501 RepID=A0A2H4SWG3_CORMI|nr:INSIG domain [Cordyceps militaris]
MSDDGPLLFRPVPRRPFTVRRQSATPTDDECAAATPDVTTTSAPPPPIGTASSPGLHSHLTAALAAWNRSGGDSANPSGRASPAISRPASIMNLTSSTLYGIYSPTGGGTRDRDDVEDSPWGMGAQTPIRRPGVDDPTFALMQERAHLASSRRRASYKGADVARALPPPMSSLQVVARTAVLFVLGLGYGALVTRLHEHEQAPPPAAAEGPVALPAFNSTYLGAWGVAGVVLGTLLPWFDGVWEARFGEPDAEEDSAGADGDNAPSQVVDTGLDSALVMRAIGAFVGIVFAIRKLAWDSTLQISATLALANPLLWWLIDRSQAGFLLSAAVGLVGSLLLLGISPDMMPAPTLQLLRNANAVNGTGDDAGATATDGPVADGQMIETGVWMLSVLFCSCLCFGNIGRRLFLGRTAAGKGRWGGVR